MHEKQRHINVSLYLSLLSLLSKKLKKNGRPSPWALGAWERHAGGLRETRSVFAFPEAEGAGTFQEALEAPQPFHPMDLESLQKGEVKQWPKDTVILLVWD